LMINLINISINTPNRRTKDFLDKEVDVPL
jgi:hypothetical protein